VSPIGFALPCNPSERDRDCCAWWRQKLVALSPVLIASLLCSDPLYAANWVRVGTEANGSVVYADIDSATSVGEYRSVWVRWDDSHDKETKAHETKQLYEFGCTSRTIRTVQWIDYDRDGKVLGSGPEYQSLERAKIVAPDSIGETLLKSVCSWILDPSRQ
jgi:hypothetical protein